MAAWDGAAVGQAAELFLLPLIRDHAGNKGAAENGAVGAWRGGGRQQDFLFLSLPLSWTKQVGGGHGTWEEG